MISGADGGHGKYDELTRELLKALGADAVLVVVLGGVFGKGASMTIEDYGNPALIIPTARELAAYLGRIADELVIDAHVAAADR